MDCTHVTDITFDDDFHVDHIVLIYHIPFLQYTDVSFIAEDGE